MKFKQIRIKTCDVAKVVNYIFREDSSAQIISTNMLTPDYADKLSKIALIRPNTNKAFEHWVLSLCKSDKPDNNTLLKITRRFLAEMGISNLNKHIAALHQDKENLHVHILLSRIGTDGSLWLGQHSVEKGMKITPILEKEFELTQTTTIEDYRNNDTTRRVSLNQHEFEQKKRTGLPTKKEIIVQYIEDSIAKSEGTMFGFFDQLETHGVHGRVIERANGSKGIRFTYNNITLKGSALGKGYSYSGIEKAVTTKSFDKGVTAPSIKSTTKQIEELKDNIDKNLHAYTEEPSRLEAEKQKKSIIERLTILKDTCPKELTYSITLLFYIVSAGLFNKQFYWVVKEHVKRLEIESREILRRIELENRTKSKSFVFSR